MDRVSRPVVSDCGLGGAVLLLLLLLLPTSSSGYVSSGRLYRAMNGVALEAVKR